MAAGGAVAYNLLYGATGEVVIERRSSDSGRGPAGALCLCGHVGALERADLLTPPLGDGARLSLGQVDQDERLRRRHGERLALEVGAELVSHARCADSRDADVDLDQVVESGRGVVLDRHRAHDELAVARLGTE